MGKKSTSKHQKDLYTAYKNNGTYAKNRLIRLKRHVKKFPDDVKAAATLKHIEKNGVQYRRKRPHNSVWTGATRATAQLFASLGTNGNYALHPEQLAADIEKNYREAMKSAKKSK